MSYQLTTDQVRLQFALDHEPGINILSSGPPRLWKGANWIIDVAVIQDDVPVDVSAWDNVYIDIGPVGDFTQANVILSSSQTTGFGTDLSLATWLDGTKQHLRFEWASGTNFELDGALEKEFTIRIYGDTTGTPSKLFAIGLATLTVVEAGIPIPTP